MDTETLIKKLKEKAFQYMDGHTHAEETVNAMIDILADAGVFSEESEPNEGE